MSLWTSPAVDILYFLNSSPTISLMKDQSVLIEEYHSVLGDTLSALGYKHLRITLEDLNELLENRGYFGMLIVLSMRNAVMLDSESVIDLDSVAKDTNKYYKFSKKYIESLKTQIPLMEEKGWFVTHF